MNGLLRLPARRVSLTIALMLVISLFMPLLPNTPAARAATDLTIGGWAMIANADGDNVLLRVDPGWSEPSLGSYPEGTIVEVLDGPYEGAEAGTLWYQVAVDRQSGFISEIYLVASDGSSAPSDPGTPTAGNGDGDGWEQPVATGTATIVNTGGDGIRCRAAANVDAEILYRFVEGETVELAGEPVDGWQPVICAGLPGFVSSEFIGVGETPVQTPDTGNTGGDGGNGGDVDGPSAVIMWTNGEEVPCRAAASADAEIIVTFTEGTVVALRGQAEGSWQPVICADLDGYVSLAYIGDSDEDPTPGTGDANGADGDHGADEGDDLEGVEDADEFESAAISGMGKIYNTNGDNVRCRTGASKDSGIIMLLREGNTLPLRGAARGNWQPVICKGKNGFVHVDFVRDITNSGGNGGNSGGTGGSGGSGGSGGNNGGGYSNSDLRSGDTAVVTGTNGDGVRLRSRASYDGSVVTVVGEGRQVTVRSGSTGDWVAVTFNGSNGFIHMDYLTRGTAGGNTGGSNGGSTGGNNGGSNGGGSGTIGSGSRAMVTENLRMRGSASTSGEVLAVAPASTVVKVTGKKSNGFYPVDWDGLAGWMHADYLTWTDAALSPREDGVGGGSGGSSGGVSGNAGSAPGSADGQEMVDYAMNYLGYPYIWATHGPKSFDCSGFTYWVTLNTIGKNIGTGTWTQSVAGVPVAYGNLQPGDLVLFQNTGSFGLSHVGIYIGNNQFIHAENEDTGVKISSLTSNYYATRWYGARRIV